MTDEPKDPLDFKFGVNFKSSAERVKGERLERQKLVDRQLKFHIGYLDDRLESILPNHLIILGAETGAGKTEIARIISSSNAKAGKRVYYFALEAERTEIERRLKFSVLSKLCLKSGAPHFSYRDWYRNLLDGYIGERNSEADEIIAHDYKTLHTYYREGESFGHEDIKRLFLAIQSGADLIVLDHLHYVDITDENENRGMKAVIKMIQNVAMSVGVPVILIAHLKKREGNSKALVPHLEMFHGSSDIIKIATHAIMLAPARSVPSMSHGVANTFVHVPKDREEGADGLIALVGFNRKLKTYDDMYTLGRQEDGQFVPLGTDDVPYWARAREVKGEQRPGRHQGLSVGMGAQS